MIKIGRNDPCPCGSGKKYKNCCLGKDREEAPSRGDKKNVDYLFNVMEKELSRMSESNITKAQDLTYDGWEALEVDLQEAEKLFKQALKLNPNLADAYNGLAAIDEEKGNLRSAEKYYRKAYEKAKLALGTEAAKAFSWWSELDTRPYMRARHGLGLVLSATGRFDEAISEFKELLRRNPNDNQGIRYLVAPTYLIGGKIEEALKEFKWYELHYKKDIPDPHYLLSWGLALYLDGQYESSAIKFRATVFSNPYLIPVILGGRPRILPIWHSNNLIEIDYAYDYLLVWGDSWKQRKDAYNFVRFVWEDDEIQRDFSKWVEYWTQLKHIKDINKRSRLIDFSREIERARPTPEFFKRMNQFLK